jgi:hypothetical protein
MCIYATISEKQKDRKKCDFELLNKGLRIGLDKLEERSAGSLEETERLSLIIARNDFEALLGTIESIQMKLAAFNPHYKNPHPMTTQGISALVKSYAKSRDTALLERFNDLVADVILREDVKMAKEIRFLIGDTLNRSDDDLGPLYGYGTALSHFMILHNRLSAL